jgi:peptidoglycan hydrolase-like protein with peptidoglycan-binding domain
MAKRNKKSAMTASILSQLPLMAGSVLLATVNRAGHWTFTRYMRAPLASTGLLAMVTLTALAGSNALYFQTVDHPSPFFGTARGEVEPLPTPSVERPETALPPIETSSAPAELSQPIPAPLASAETTGSVTAPASVPDAPVGNTKMFEVQKKLFELGLFTGQVDGYYGPRTANAIRAFEQRNGMKLTGSTDTAVLDAILSSDSAGRVAQPQAQAAPPAPQPAPPVVQQAALAVAPTTPTPPAPVAQQAQSAGQATAPSRAEQALDTVAQSAASTIDSIIAAVDVPRSTPKPIDNPPIPAASVPAATSQATPTALPPIPATQPVAPATQPVQAARQPAANPTPYVPPATDAELVSQIQRGLASLGFFRAPIDGKPGAETARAIREFENFHSYRMTGQVKPDLVELLLKAGATI